MSGANRIKFIMETAECSIFEASDAVRRHDLRAANKDAADLDSLKAALLNAFPESDLYAKCFPLSTTAA